MVAFCFSMTVGIVWEFIECAGDMFFGQDMQKDFIVRSFQSVTLDPTGNQIPIAVHDITDTVIHTASGKSYLIEEGYLDVGILDTMKDLLVLPEDLWFGLLKIKKRDWKQFLMKSTYEPHI